MHVLNSSSNVVELPLAGLRLLSKAAGLYIKWLLPFVVISANSASLPDNFELNDLVAVAVTQSPTVKSSQSSLQASVAAKEEADWNRYPSIGVQSENRFATAGGSGSSGTPVLVQISQPVWSGGRLTAQLEAAEAKRQAAQWALEESRWSVAARVANAWRSLLAAQELVQASEVQIARLGVYTDMITRRVKSEVSPAVDLDLLKSRLLQARTELNAAQSQRALALNRLSLAAGIPLTVRDAERMQGAAQQETQAVSVFPKDFAARLTTAVDAHPTVRRVVAETAAASQDIKVADARRFPEVLGRYQYQTSGSSVNGLNTSQSGFALVLNYNSGSGFSLDAQARGALARYNVQLNAGDSSRNEVSEALFADGEDFRSASERMAAVRETIAQSQAILESSGRLFVAGRRSWLDLLNTERELSQAEKGVAPLRAQLVAASYLTRMRLGQLAWQRLEVVP
jgi:adhesin transport system outer membrane protein